MTTPVFPTPAIDLIRHFDGLRLSAYRCPAGVLTIGYGHTGDVVEGQTITTAVADRLLAADLAAVAANVDRAVRVPLTDAQRSALIAFAFNVGAAAFRSSTLLKRLNAGDTEGAAGQFGRWIYATVNGQKATLPGLVRRRAAEEALFRGSDWRAAEEALVLDQAQKVEAAPAPAPLVRSAPAQAATATLALGGLAGAIGPIGDMVAPALQLVQQVQDTAGQVQAVAGQLQEAQHQVTGAVATVSAIGAGPSWITGVLAAGLVATLALQIWERRRAAR